MKKFKRILALSFLVCVVLSLGACACSNASKLTGSWVCDEVHGGYPDQMHLNSDGTGTADGMNCNWSVNDGKIIFSLMLGSYDYQYKFEGSKLYLDDYSYTKSE